MSDLIDVSHEGDLWVVTLNRSDKANALTADMLNQLADIAQDARHAKAFILTGRGKVFSAGADLAPQPSDPIRMAKLIGPARTKMILLAGQKIAAETAQNWGLVDAITKPDALLQTAKDWCGDVLGADHRNAPSIKAAIDRA